ncbi:hypothetical protein B0H14DRAFT_2402754 [Mycena olivaceomarginata]|nr:hypothetical protein B0H14DRAFT_2402754 [Mycena olivaceomarginata]
MYKSLPDLWLKYCAIASYPSAFLSYTAPDPSTLYSGTYFAALTFNQVCCTGLSYPSTSPGPSQHGPSPMIFLLTLNPKFNLVKVFRILLILQGMEQAFSAGTRSVAVLLVVSGKHIDRLYHLSKLRLFMHLNNNKIAVESAHAIALHLHSIPLVSSNQLDHFLGLLIRLPIFGFCVADFPLWKLSCLLGEEWLHEDVLNALAELLYFTQAADSSSEMPWPSTLILPTHFLNDAKYLFDQSQLSFSPNLAALRRQLKTTSVDKVFCIQLPFKPLFHLQSIGVSSAWIW